MRFRAVIQCISARVLSSDEKGWPAIEAKLIGADKLEIDMLVPQTKHNQAVIVGESYYIDLTPVNESV